VQNAKSRQLWGTGGFQSTTQRRIAWARWGQVPMNGDPTGLCAGALIEGKISALGF